MGLTLSWNDPSEFLLQTSLLSGLGLDLSEKLASPAVADTLVQYLLDSVRIIDGMAPGSICFAILTAIMHVPTMSLNTSIRVWTGRCSSSNVVLNPFLDVISFSGAMLEQGL